MLSAFVTCDITHALSKAALKAFYGHHPLVIRPDDVWFCIAQGFATHVRENAESLRSRFVTHSGKKKLVVVTENSSRTRIWSTGKSASFAWRIDPTPSSTSGMSKDQTSPAFLKGSRALRCSTSMSLRGANTLCASSRGCSAWNRASRHTRSPLLLDGRFFTTSRSPVGPASSMDAMSASLGAGLMYSFRARCADLGTACGGWAPPPARALPGPFAAAVFSPRLAWRGHRT